MLASPGWLYLRETQYGEEHFAQPTQQHLIALDSEQGLLKYFPLATGPGTQLLEALGTLSLIGASITALDGVAALQIRVEGGHVAHIEAADEAERDRWTFECNLAGLRAASSALESAASNPPVEHYTNGVAAAILAPPQVEPYQPPKRLWKRL